MKVFAPVKRNTEPIGGGNQSRLVAGMSKTLGKTSGSVTVGRVPVGSPRARDFNLHGFPKTLKTLREINDSARAYYSACVSPTECQKNIIYIVF